MRVRVRDCVYWGWGPFWALVVQVLIWWPIVGLVVRVAPSHPMMGPHLPFYVVLFSLPFVGIAVNFCLFLFLRADIAIGLFLPVAFLLTFLFILFPMPIRELGMYMLGSVVYGLYPGILLNNYYELYRVAKMSPEEVEEYRREHEAREAREEQYEEKTADVYVSLLFLMFFVIVGFFAVGIPAMHWKGYDPSPMIFPAVVVTVAGMAVSVLVKRVLEWKVPGWVYAVLLVVSVVGVLLVWGYPVVLLVAPWWAAFWIGESWLGLVEDTIRRKLGNIPR